MRFSSGNTTHETLRPNFYDVIAPTMMNKNHHQILAGNHRGNVAHAAARPWPAKAPASLGDANCMEQMLVHCANAIESDDATLAQQILWVLNNVAPPDGDANQRLAAAFLRALVARAARRGCRLLDAVAAAPAAATHRFSAVELAGFIDLTPWHRFGFTAANAAILDAADGFPAVHVVDLGLAHCMQIPTLVDAFASRHENPPLLKLTVVAEPDTGSAGPPGSPGPTLDMSYDELGRRLVAFARSRNVPLEFRIIVSTYADGFASLVETLASTEPNRLEALILNCHMRLHHIPEETGPLRSMFLKSIRALDPTAVILVDEDADFSSTDLVNRIRSAFNYLWIHFDTMETLAGRGRQEREWYEAEIGRKVENVVAGEGLQRVERQEPKGRWAGRLRTAGFRAVGFGDETGRAEVKAMLDEHAAGWGVKREDDDLVLTWKGHNVVFATLWVPV